MKKFIIVIIFLIQTTIYSYADMNSMTDALSTFITSDLLSSYATINTVADLYEYGHYDNDKTLNLISVQDALIDQKQQSIKKLIDSDDFVGEDVQFGYDLIQTYGFMKQEIKYFYDYMKNRNDQNAVKNFHYFREKAWSNIQRLLDLK
ncbi:hypothetical protein DEFDS_1591 [Deferribacter desulfuricans SSM1]|uniref:DUF4142 domain-containing protein n=1 Tax=Deferribacter desulfuricans (strain DSM 14783 / JCM 11476 / NBRC 101012 / SSM1) TaxID=639282 RepID=D3P8K9_DEFDS|nr:hypothetical protein [Deferribacter desulfuricans]BAI81049.1 hypothetical protein DEFDS_1591 [Deferribacter desulfuricans SSM1]